MFGSTSWDAICTGEAQPSMAPWNASRRLGRPAYRAAAPADGSGYVLAAGPGFVVDHAGSVCEPAES